MRKGAKMPLIVLLGALLFFSRNYETVLVTGHSMVPTLQPGDYLLCTRGVPKAVAIKDMVLVKEPGTRKSPRILIKRVAEIKDNTYYVLGDNSADSVDSRSFGWIAEENITGRVLLRLFPLERAGLLENAQ